jgi:hypothetical protein
MICVPPIGANYAGKSKGRREITQQLAGYGYKAGKSDTPLALELCGSLRTVGKGVSSLRGYRIRDAKVLHPTSQCPCQLQDGVN